ncbi:calcium-binding protein [Roseovarius aestuariivivens]|uniref:calcium-binding protein n=1 Tax=Roseovarius aestuariivivens TaxID=1888910 RepID=UPI0010800FD7|nr:calcium-binding protein [Roseovarius aestuariivivens]
MASFVTYTTYPIAANYPEWLPRIDFENSVLSADSGRIEILNRDGSLTILNAAEPFRYFQGQLLPYTGSIQTIIVLETFGPMEHIRDISSFVPVTDFLKTLLAEDEQMLTDLLFFDAVRLSISDRGGVFTSNFVGTDRGDNFDFRGLLPHLINAEGGEDWIRADGPTTVFGGDGTDRVWTGNFDDFLNGENDDDGLYGGYGSDVINGGPGDDYLQGGSNAATTQYADRDTISGNDGNDHIFGGTDNDRIFGGNGLDTISGQDGDDYLDGGAQNDRLFGDDGSDTLEGQEGDDDLDGGRGDDILNGGSGNDTLFGDQGNDTLEGGSGHDLVSYFSPFLYPLYGVKVDLRARQAIGDEGTDQLIDIEGAIGSSRSDTLLGSAGADELIGGGSDDSLSGRSGDDTLDGGPGADLLIGGPGSDMIYVDEVGDQVSESRSWAGHDTVISSVDFRMGRKHIEDLELTGTATIGAGNGLTNRITGNEADNVLDGGKNNDTLVGGLGNDRYLVRAPGDTIVEQFNEGVDTALAYRSYALPAHVENLYMQKVYTKDGDPAIFNGIGNGLNNTIVGTPFANFIIGREGRDTLKGQAGADTFVFDRTIGPNNVDRIIDFNVNDANEGDQLLMKATEFIGMAAGVLDPNAFANGTGAADASDRFIFDQTSGQLWFDPDGTGAAEQVLIATFEQNATVTAANIEIF